MSFPREPLSDITYAFPPAPTEIELPREPLSDITHAFLPAPTEIDQLPSSPFPDVPLASTPQQLELELEDVVISRSKLLPPNANAMPEFEVFQDQHKVEQDFARCAQEADARSPSPSPSFKRKRDHEPTYYYESDNDGDVESEYESEDDSEDEDGGSDKENDAPPPRKRVCVYRDVSPLLSEESTFGRSSRMSRSTASSDSLPTEWESPLRAKVGVATSDWYSESDEPDNDKENSAPLAAYSYYDIEEVEGVYYPIDNHYEHSALFAGCASPEADEPPTSSDESTGSLGSLVRNLDHVDIESAGSDVEFKATTMRPLSFSDSEEEHVVEDEKVADEPYYDVPVDVFRGDEGDDETWKDILTQNVERLREQLRSTSFDFCLWETSFLDGERIVVLRKGDREVVLNALVKPLLDEPYFKNFVKALVESHFRYRFAANETIDPIAAEEWSRFALISGYVDLDAVIEDLDVQ